MDAAFAPMKQQRLRILTYLDNWLVSSKEQYHCYPVSAVRAYLESGPAPERQENKPPALPDEIVSGEELLEDESENHDHLIRCLIVTYSPSS